VINGGRVGGFAGAAGDGLLVVGDTAAGEAVSVGEGVGAVDGIFVVGDIGGGEALFVVGGIGTGGGDTSVAMLANANAMR
jgi:hypothetical protein